MKIKDHHSPVSLTWRAHKSERTGDETLQHLPEGDQVVVGGVRRAYVCGSYGAPSRSPYLHLLALTVTVIAGGGRKEGRIVGIGLCLRRAVGRLHVVVGEVLLEVIGVIVVQVDSLHRVILVVDLHEVHHVDFSR